MRKTLALDQREATGDPVAHGSAQSQGDQDAEQRPSFITVRPDVASLVLLNIEQLL